jgi:cytochrome b
MSTPSPSRRVLVWDLPLRVFHWLLAAAFLAAWAIAVTVDDESRLFALHAGLGVFISALVVFRLVWGVIGTRYARFRGFAYPLADLLAYLKGIVRVPAREFVGHNPASAYATFAMLILLVGLVATGLLLGSGIEFVEELHEVLAHTMLAVVAVHVLGVVLHTVRQRDPIALGMFDGRKRGAPSDGIRSARPVSALVLGVLLVWWAGGLWRSYDGAANTLTLPLLGVTVTPGEREHEHEHAGRRGWDGEHDEDEEDDDDD